MKANTTRGADKQDDSSLHAKRQRASAARLPERGGPAATLLNLHRTHGNRFVQRLLASATHHQADAPSEVEEAIARTRGDGQTLSPGVRSHMESAFGADFGAVRLHTDATADALSRSLSAVAFTTGRDIYFRQGEYDPEGAGGRRLLAHELTHVTQQAGTTPGGKLVVGAPDDVYEQEADQMADAAMNHTPERDSPHASPPTGPAPGDSMQRMCAECEEQLAAHATTNEEEKDPAAG